MSTTAIVSSDAIVPEPLVSDRKMKKKKEIFYIDGVENGVSEGKYEEAYRSAEGMLRVCFPTLSLANPFSNFIWAKEID